MENNNKYNYFEIRQVLERLLDKMDKNDSLGKIFQNCGILYISRLSLKEESRYCIRIFPYRTEQVAICDKQTFGNKYKVIKSNTCPLVEIELVMKHITKQIVISNYSMPLNILVPFKGQNIKIINKNTISYLLLINQLLLNNLGAITNQIIDEIKSYVLL